MENITASQLRIMENELSNIITGHLLDFVNQTGKMPRLNITHESMYNGIRNVVTNVGVDVTVQEGPYISASRNFNIVTVTDPGESGVVSQVRCFIEVPMDRPWNPSGKHERGRTEIQMIEIPIPLAQYIQTLRKNLEEIKGAMEKNASLLNELNSIWQKK